MIPDCDRDSVQVTRRKQIKYVRSKQETFGNALHSNMTLPGHGIASRCIPRTLESNDDYLTPVHALERSTEVMNETVIHSPVEQNKEMEMPSPLRRVGVVILSPVGVAILSQVEVLNRFHTKVLNRFHTKIEFHCLLTCRSYPE